MRSAMEIGTQAMTGVRVVPVTTAAQQEQFLDMPAIVYANDPNWVQPLRSSVAKQLAPTNSFLQYGRLQPFIAFSEDCNSDRPVGRIVAAVNRRLVEKEGQSIGLFGFFECIHDLSVAQALFNAAFAWLRQQGMTRVRGPINLSTHNNCLMLIDGFDSPPMLMMPYNPPYYPQLMEQLGWQPAKDAYAYELSLDQPLPPQYEKGYRIAVESGVQFRKLDLKPEAFRRDMQEMYHLFNQAFVNNWSSSPRTEEEFLAEADDLRSLADPDGCWFAEYDGKMIGFFIGLPDYNQVLKRVHGKLNWLGMLKFFWYRRQIDQARVLLIASLPEFRRKMVPLALIHLGITNGARRGKPYKRAELGHVYEDNLPSRKMIEATRAKIYKTYRIYEIALDQPEQEPA
jgi:hypothetical protein